MTSRELLRELRTVLAQLELISQVPAVNLESSGGRDAGESIGGKRPPGGILRVDDREHDYPQKSVEHFKRRIAKAHSRHVLEVILDDAKKALEAARRQPAPGSEPNVCDPDWKRFVAESPAKATDLARKYGVKRSYIEKVRKQYSDEEAA